MRILDLRRFEGQGVEVRHVVEEISPRGQPGTSGLAFATNVYELTDGGWRMVVHHASANPTAPSPEERPAPTHTLH